jgi:acetylornithine deacetylase/succinyl-diaminopimelate desuccinylase-like protein
MIEFTKKLITFNTTHKENKALEFIQKHVQNKYGDKLTYEKQEIWDKNRYNLIIKNSENPNVILAWHMDTVPELSQDQFIPRIEDGKLYGRGSVDMKAWIAINIFLIDFMIENKINFRIVCYADEEYNFLGMKKFTEKYQSQITPKLTIVTEPTNGKILTWFRGMGAIDMEIKGKSVHSAKKHLWINAISEYVHFVDHLEEYIQSKDINGYTSLSNLAWIYGWIEKGWNIIWQYNIVPNIAKGAFSLRLGNRFSPQKLEEYTREYFTKRDIEILNINIKSRHNPLIQPELKEKYEKYGIIEEGHTFWYSDIQFIKEYIWGDCLLLGPWPNEKAHQIDEYVEIESLEKAKATIENILKAML